jgi:hypothetical protein
MVSTGLRYSICFQRSHVCQHWKHNPAVHGPLFFSYGMGKGSVCHCSPKFSVVSDALLFCLVLTNSFLGSSSRLYVHTATKLMFVCIFRHSEHIHSHTLLGWTVWTLLCFAGTAIAAIPAIAFPIFSYLIGITEALFAAWYT